MRAFQQRGQPVVSLDTKKWMGTSKTRGREWRSSGEPEGVRVSDVVDPYLAEPPYGVSDLTLDTGWVSVGTDHNTAELAVETLRCWWRHRGSPVYPAATDLLIPADGGGSNGSRCRLWKITLHRLADQLRVAITVCHFPPGTSKWNKSEHRVFSQIALNWRGQRPVTHEVIAHLIANTTT